MQMPVKVNPKPEQLTSLRYLSGTEAKFFLGQLKRRVGRSSVEVVAKTSGVSERTLYNWFSGRCVPVKSYRNVVRKLGMRSKTANNIFSLTPTGVEYFRDLADGFTKLHKDDPTMRTEFIGRCAIFLQARLHTLGVEAAVNIMPPSKEVAILEVEGADHRLSVEIQSSKRHMVYRLFSGPKGKAKPEGVGLLHDAGAEFCLEFLSQPVRPRAAGVPVSLRAAGQLKSFYNS